MHLTVLTSFVRTVMADGHFFCEISELSHAFLSRELELSAGQHMYRIPITVVKRIVLLDELIEQLPKT